jgi:high-affinity Fe2+/Pb2+ permease
LRPGSSVPKDGFKLVKWSCNSCKQTIVKHFLIWRITLQEKKQIEFEKGQEKRQLMLEKSQLEIKHDKLKAMFYKEREEKYNLLFLTRGAILRKE